ncbi:MAK10-like protein [Tanacetum coccineum]
MFIGTSHNGSFLNRSFNNNPQKISNLEGLVSNFMASQDARLSKFETNFKQQQGEMTNKINTVLKAINDRITGALPSDTVKNLKFNVNSTSPVFSTRSYPAEDPQCSSYPLKLINAIKACSKEANHSQKLKLGLLEETGHVFGLVDGTKFYPVGIVKNVEVHIERLKLLDDFYIIDMEKDPATPLLVGRGFLVTANVVIDCKKAKISVGEGITRSIFRVKETDLGEEEVPYWTTLSKRELYKPRSSLDGIGAHPLIMLKKDFMDCHLPGEWEIARDAKLNPFKDVLVLRRIVKFLGALPVNLKGNMWESKDLIENPINWNRPPKKWRWCVACYDRID